VINGSGDVVKSGTGTLQLSGNNTYTGATMLSAGTIVVAGGNGIGNNSAAGQYALRLQSVEAQLAENRTQLEQAETTYKNLVKARDVAVQTARAKIESLKGAINDMRMKQAMAELHEMSAGMITNIGGSGDTLNRLEGMVMEERDKAAGRARVARDAVDMSQVDIKEAEMTALADQALADFAAREGITLKGAAAPQPAERSMGAAEPIKNDQGQ
jgi:autotransporter-associated beta strand protein